VRRGDVVRVTDTRDGSVREGVYSGSGDWGVRFRYQDSSFRGFQVEDWQWEYFEFEVIGVSP